MSRVAQTTKQAAEKGTVGPAIIANPTHELHTGDLNVGQPPRIELGAGEEIDHEQVIVTLDSPLISDQLENLAFAEQPVTIRIERSSEKFAPKVVDCWVNGKGAEVLLNGKWQETGFFPVGIPVITKRKYVEVLARSKVDSVTTQTGTTQDEDPKNIIDRSTSSKSPFSVIQDKNPMGAEWLTRLLQEG